MDTSEYLPMFLAECREHLQELNLAVVRLEEAHDNPETLDEIFRAAHSLKGMSATMGFDGIARLTHQMEDVFETLRQRTTALPVALVDVLLECLDALSAAIDAIDQTGSERIDPDVLIGRLRALVREADADAEIAPIPEPSPTRAASVVALSDGERVLEVVATLADEAVMPSVRAFMVLQAVAEHGRIVSSEPDLEQVDGFAGTEIRILLATGHEEEEVETAVSGVDDIATVTIGLPGGPATPAPAVPAEALVVVAPTAAAPATPVVPAPVADAPTGPTEVPAPAERRGKGSATVRVDAERLDQLMHYMGELVVQRTHVEMLAAQADVPGLSQAVQELTRSSHALQDMVMQIRMVPVEAVLLRFPRLVRDASSRLGKQVDLQIVGKDTELDRTVVDALGDPLVHLIRNALDHGLETPEDRVAAGKPETGTLVIAARHAGGSIVISVRDDGRGVDPVKVGARALDRGLITAEQAEALDVAGAVELLFAPGFSTAETVGDLSGRGVGMDAVRDKIRRLGGEAVVTSVTGQGTNAEIRLPLTLAIMSALLVEADGRPYAIPLNRVERTMRIADQTLRSVAGQKMLVLEDESVPVRSAAEAFGHVESEPAEETHLVLVRASDRSVALAVSGLIGQRELVTRPLPEQVGGQAVSGAAVLSDGDIVLLADVDALTHPPIPTPVRQPA